MSISTNAQLIAASPLTTDAITPNPIVSTAPIGQRNDGRSPRGERPQQYAAADWKKLLHQPAPDPNRRQSPDRRAAVAPIIAAAVVRVKKGNDRPNRVRCDHGETRTHPLN
jgi:hypothetical protein